MKIQHLGRCAYSDVYQKMRDFTAKRTAHTADEVWLCEHPPVFTYGWHGDLSHILDPHDIPVIPCDRGGQVTYHGPGQLMAYCLFDLRRKKQGVAAFVIAIERLVIDTLAHFGIIGHVQDKMPGVYVHNQKIAAIGLRIRNGCSYHGLAVNVDMDLTPFSYIHPCGYQNLAVTDMQHWTKCTFKEVADQLAIQLQKFI